MLIARSPFELASCCFYLRIHKLFGAFHFRCVLGTCDSFWATMFRQLNQAILVCAVFVVVNCFPDGGPADTCITNTHLLFIVLRWKSNALFICNSQKVWNPRDSINRTMVKVEPSRLERYHTRWLQLPININPDSKFKVKTNFHSHFAIVQEML